MTWRANKESASEQSLALSFSQLVAQYATLVKHITERNKAEMHKVFPSARKALQKPTLFLIQSL